MSEVGKVLAPSASTVAGSRHETKAHGSHRLPRYLGHHLLVLRLHEITGRLSMPKLSLGGFLDRDAGNVFRGLSSQVRTHGMNAQASAHVVLPSSCDSWYPICSSRMIEQITVHTGTFPVRERRRIGHWEVAWESCTMLESAFELVSPDSRLH